MGLIFSILLLGLVLGSLANTFIYRIPLSFYPDKKTSSNFKLLGTRSRCTSCEEIIPIYLNIPVVSYLYLKGKCRFCNKPISLIYPIIEISTACIFLLIYLKIGINTFFFFYARFSSDGRWQNRGLLIDCASAFLLIIDRTENLHVILSQKLFIKDKTGGFSGGYFS